MSDITKRMRAYITRLGDEHTAAFAKILKKRDATTLDEIDDADLFAFGEELRATAELPTAYVMARARGISLTSDGFDDEAETENDPHTTARAINEIALALYDKADTGGASLIDAVPEGASVSEAMNAMGVAANTLRKRRL